MNVNSVIMPQWQGKSAIFLFIKKSIHANILSHIQKIAKTESERETLTFPA